MNRPGGIPIIVWAGAVVAGIAGFVILRKRQAASGGSASPATTGKTGQPAFSQAQEVQDFQVFSSLTSAQQGADLNFLTEVAGLFGGGSSPTTNTPASPTGSSSPPSTGTAPPATVAASAAPAAAAPAASSEPGYGANIGTLLAQNPGIATAPGIAGYQVTYNGVPI